MQRRFLRTSPLRTGRNAGATEVGVLTWRRDWMNVLSALKSFYHFAEVDLPLYVHDGGLRSAAAPAGCHIRLASGGQ
jgi:hypothetical protein